MRGLRAGWGGGDAVTQPSGIRCWRERGADHGHVALGIADLPSDPRSASDLPGERQRPLPRHGADAAALLEGAPCRARPWHEAARHCTLFMFIAIELEPRTRLARQQPKLEAETRRNLPRRLLRLPRQTLHLPSLRLPSLRLPSLHLPSLASGSGCGVGLCLYGPLRLCCRALAPVLGRQSPRRCSRIHRAAARWPVASTPVRTEGGRCLALGLQPALALLLAPLLLAPLLGEAARCHRAHHACVPARCTALLRRTTPRPGWRQRPGARAGG